MGSTFRPANNYGYEGNAGQIPNTMRHDMLEAANRAIPLNKRDLESDRNLLRKWNRIDDKLRNIRTSRDRKSSNAKHVGQTILLPLTTDTYMPRLHGVDTFEPSAVSTEYVHQYGTSPNLVASTANNSVRSMRRKYDDQKQSFSSHWSSESTTTASSLKRSENSHHQTIYGWNNMSLTGKAQFEEESDYFMACTPIQLSELDAAVVERVKVVKPYIGPPPTPMAEAIDDYDICSIPVGTGVRGRLVMDVKTGLTKMTIHDILHYSDFVPIDLESIQNRSKYLSGHRETGIQVLGTNLPFMYKQNDNLSSHYQLPFIESAEETRAYYHPSLSQDAINLNDGKEWEDEPQKFFSYLPKNMGFREEIAPKVWFKKRDFLPKKTQRPAASLILYLLGKGRSVGFITDLIIRLDNTFVYESSSRWWHDFRIPEHWQFDDDMVAKVTELCKRTSLQREGEEGSITSAHPPQQGRGKVQARTLVKQVIEQYLWWRLRGGEKLGNNGGVYGNVGHSALVGFDSIAASLPTTLPKLR